MDRAATVTPQVARKTIGLGAALDHFSDLADVERAWAGAVQVTTAARTVIDCATAAVSPGIVVQAIDEGMHRGLFTAEMIEPASEVLRSFNS